MLADLNTVRVSFGLRYPAGLDLEMIAGRIGPGCGGDVVSQYSCSRVLGRFPYPYVSAADNRTGIRQRWSVSEYFVGLMDAVIQDGWGRKG